MSNRLLDNVKSHFGSGAAPTKEALVRFDGFDELDKVHAIDIFSGKTIAEILNAISKGNFGNLGDIEDLIVMEPAGYQYYLAPYLLQIIRDQEEAEEDLTLPGLVIFSIQEIVRIRGKEAFSEGQRQVLLDIISYLARRSSQWNSDDAFIESLKEKLDFLKVALAAV